jgi:processive 1,2-diacylglycerol beta-glucosyltransferase
MERPARILIASASAGTGHLAAAEALRRALTEMEPGSTVEHVDVLQLGPQWVRAAYADGFEVLASRAPRIWKEVYSWTDGGVDAPRWGAAVQRALFPGFRHLLAAGKWDAVVCTHFLPCQLSAGGAGLPPFALVTTDFMLHRYWVQPRVSWSFVATDAMAAEVRRRIPGARVDATGIPVHAEFGRPPEKVAARAALGLPAALPVALVMGGGLGIGVAATARAVAAAPTGGLQVLVVTGSNFKARHELAALAAAEPRVRVLGRVGNVHELMAAADLVVTKPGGLTTSEALAVGRPLLLTRAIPGHEEGNAAALARAGAAIYAPDDAAVFQSVEKLVVDPALRRRTGEAARRMGRPDAARAVAAGVMDRLKLGRVA